MLKKTLSRPSRSQANEPKRPSSLHDGFLLSTCSTNFTKQLDHVVICLDKATRIVFVLIRFVYQVIEPYLMTSNRSLTVISVLVAVGVLVILAIIASQFAYTAEAKDESVSLGPVTLNDTNATYPGFYRY